MHPGTKFQFDRVAREFSQWRAILEKDRSPAPAFERLRRAYWAN
jgi:hypothetical protein